MDVDDIGAHTYKNTKTYRNSMPATDYKNIIHNNIRIICVVYVI